MTDAVLFEVSYNGHTYGFTARDQSADLFDSLRATVASIVHSNLFELLYNDGEKNVVLEGSAELSTAIGLALFTRENPSTSPCVRLSVGEYSAAKLKTINEGYKLEIEDLKNQLTKKDEDLNLISANQQADVKRFKGEMTGLISRNDKDCLKLEEELQEAERRIRELEEKNIANTRVMSNDLEKLEEENQSLKSRIALLEDDLFNSRMNVVLSQSEYETRIGEMQRESTIEMNKYKEEIDRLTRKYVSWSDECSDFLLKNAEMEAQIQEYKQIMELEEEDRKKAEIKIECLKESEKAQQLIIEELESRSKSVVEVEERMAQMEIQKKQMLQDISQQQNEVYQMSSELSTWYERYNQLSYKNIEMETQLLEKTEEIKNLNAEADYWNKQYNDLVYKNEEMEDSAFLEEAAAADEGHAVEEKDVTSDDESGWEMDEEEEESGDEENEEGEDERESMDDPVENSLHHQQQTKDDDDTDETVEKNRKIVEKMAEMKEIPFSERMASFAAKMEAMEMKKRELAERIKKIEQSINV